MQINKLILPGYLILIQSSHNNSLLREAFKIEKKKCEHFHTSFFVFFSFQKVYIFTRGQGQGIIFYTFFVFF